MIPVLRTALRPLFVVAVLALSAGAAAGEERDTESGTLAILSAVSNQWFKGEWTAYQARFVSPDGRVIDNANSNISHSEGQGYGLLLASDAGDAKAFDLIWGWTREHLRKRPDALFAWKWDAQEGKATDLNTASDGDLLIAWALARAARRFGRVDYKAEARHIVEALAVAAVIQHGKETLLLPGATGFGAKEQKGGPVVNLSYWVFAAFHELAPLAPHLDWDGLRQSGLRLIEASRFGPLALPSDWVALGGPVPVPAPGFAAQFGYDAIRIPLYLAQDPGVPRAALSRFVDPALPGSTPAGPAVTDAATGEIRQPMRGMGYRMVFALARCSVRGETIPRVLLSNRDELYYPETLRLLCIAVMLERFPQCL